MEKPIKGKGIFCRKIYFADFDKKGCSEEGKKSFHLKVLNIAFAVLQHCSRKHPHRPGIAGTQHAQGKGRSDHVQGRGDKPCLCYENKQVLQKAGEKNIY